MVLRQTDIILKLCINIWPLYHFYRKRYTPDIALFAEEVKADFPITVRKV